MHSAWMHVCSHFAVLPDGAGGRTATCVHAWKAHACTSHHPSPVGAPPRPPTHIHTLWAGRQLHRPGPSTPLPNPQGRQIRSLIRLHMCACPSLHHLAPCLPPKPPRAAPGLLYCMDFLEKNLDWLQERLEPLIQGAAGGGRHAACTTCRAAPSAPPARCGRRPPPQRSPRRCSCAQAGG
jgi:hypothetical protein